MSNLFENSRGYLQSRCTTGIDDAGSKYATGVNDTGGKFATNTASVVDTGGKFAAGVIMGTLYRLLTP